MTINPITKIIRAKKLGVLIRDARLKSDKSLEECAQAMGVQVDEFSSMELGERPPTLPELELFAYTLELPLEHFWGNQTVKEPGSDTAVNPEEVSRLRQGVIGDLIRQGRTQVNLSIEELGQKTGIAPEKLTAYEQGEAAIPLPELEIMAQALNNSIAYFESQQGSVGSKFTQQKLVKEFQNLPMELQEFVSMPINRPYLELAVRLSELKVERLRALGEGLLEITL